MRGGKKVVPGLKRWIVVTKKSRAESFLGPAEKQATVIAGNWKEVESVARGEAAMAAHLHIFWNV